MPLQNAGRDVRMADRAEQDRIEPAKLVDAVFRQRLARFEIPLAAPIERCELQRNVFQLGGRLQDLYALGGDFRTRAVAANDGNLVRDS